ncbi:hypothetical protein NK8_64410 (plasmid) [Caballeronia sp. NK8]|nr:hypothetical protein NK8_64410 [Caballeronia sp. NK8]
MGGQAVAILRKYEALSRPTSKSRLPYYGLAMPDPGKESSAATASIMVLSHLDANAQSGRPLMHRRSMCPVSLVSE